MTHFEQILRIQLYVPDFEGALQFYQSLGLEVKTIHDVTPKSALLQFAKGSTELCLHNDPQRQFVDVEVRVESVRQLYQTLSQNPSVQWLQTPQHLEAGWRAAVRTPDGNVWVLVSDT